jgi:predicted DNA-binding protein
MGSNSSQAFATRLPDDTAEQLEAILEDTDLTKSELGRRAFRFYLDEDPDTLQGPDVPQSIEELMAEMLE